MSYLNELHPEVFAIAPRTGGIVKIKPRKLKTVGSRHSSTKNLPTRGSKGTIRSTSRKSSKGTLKTTTTTGTFDSKFFRMSSTPAPPAPKKTTREYRIKKILSSSPWMLFEDDEDEVDNTQPPDPLHDTLTILAATISTIMLLAAEYKDIPREQLMWTLSYLECVRDDYDNYPPNVRGIMNNIKLIDNTLVSYFNEEEDTKSDITGIVFGPTQVEGTPSQQ